MVAVSSFVNFLYSQFFITPEYPKGSCEGKTIIVTGANTGLGYEAAKHFVRLGASKVIIACRNLEKGQEAAKTIELEESRSNVVEVWELDLTKYESVKKFAARADGLKRIDVVVENAGVATERYSRAEDNESTITVNVVSTFLLALLLLPVLKRSAELNSITPNLVIVSSEVHGFINFPERDAQPSIFDELNNPKTANMGARYPMSKLLEVLTIREMCQKHIPQPYPVTMNYLNPGFCHSSLSREKDGFAMNLFKWLLCRTTEMGGRTLVISALAGKETHGEYMSDGVVTPPSPFVRSQDGERAQERVWQELSQKLETIQPGILNNL